MAFQRRDFIVGLLVLAVVAAGCGSSTASGSAGPSAGVQGATAAATIAPATPTSGTSQTMTEPPSGSTPVAPVDVHPCRLLTTEQVSQLAGVQVDAGKETTQASEAICSWSNATTHQVVSLTVADYPTASQAQVAYAEAEATAHGFQLTKVSGIGDQAEVGRTGASGVAAAGIYVRRGTLFFSLTFVGMGNAPDDIAFEDAARTVLSGLP